MSDAMDRDRTVARIGVLVDAIYTESPAALPKILDELTDYTYLDQEMQLIVSDHLTMRGVKKLHQLLTHWEAPLRTCAAALLIGVSFFNAGMQDYICALPNGFDFAAIHIFAATNQMKKVENGRFAGLMRCISYYTRTNKLPSKASPVNKHDFLEFCTAVETALQSETPVSYFCYPPKPERAAASWSPDPQTHLIGFVRAENLLASRVKPDPEMWENEADSYMGLENAEAVSTDTGHDHFPGPGAARGDLDGVDGLSDGVSDWSAQLAADEAARRSGSDLNDSGGRYSGREEDENLEFSEVYDTHPDGPWESTPVKEDPNMVSHGSRVSWGGLVKMTHQESRAATVGGGLGSRAGSSMMSSTEGEELPARVRRPRSRLRSVFKRAIEKTSEHNNLDPSLARHMQLGPQAAEFKFRSTVSSRRLLHGRSEASDTYPYPLDPHEAKFETNKQSYAPSRIAELKREKKMLDSRKPISLNAPRTMGNKASSTSSMGNYGGSSGRMETGNISLNQSANLFNSFGHSEMSTQRSRRAPGGMLNSSSPVRNTSMSAPGTARSPARTPGVTARGFATTPEPMRDIRDTEIEVELARPTSLTHTYVSPHKPRQRQSQWSKNPIKIEKAYTGAATSLKPLQDSSARELMNNFQRMLSTEKPPEKPVVKEEEPAPTPFQNRRPWQADDFDDDDEGPFIVARHGTAKPRLLLDRVKETEGPGHARVGGPTGSPGMGNKTPSKVFRP